MAVFEQALAIIIVFLLLGSLVFLARRRGGWQGLGRTGGAAGPVAIRQRIPLTPQHTLHVIGAGAHTLLLVTYPAGAAVHECRRGFAEELERAARGQGV